MEEQKGIVVKVRKFAGSRVFIKILCVLGALLVAKIIFFAGVIVGYHRASFGHAWDEHYKNNFGLMPRPGHFRSPFMEDYFPNAHGAAGKIIKVELPTFIVEDQGNTEKVVLIKDDTRIQKADTIGTSADIKVDAYVVVIGNPNDKGQIEAKFIRIMPMPAVMMPDAKITR